MPSSVVVEHNSRKMTFTESDHSYVDDNGKRYCSVTQLIGEGFEKFDAVAVAKKKDPLNWQFLVNAWKSIGQTAADAGTRLHHNCEQLILGRPERCYKPESPQEMINFSLAEKQVNKIKENRLSVDFKPELLVFSEKLGLAGSVDLLVENSDGSYFIYDWKNIKSLEMNGVNGKTGILPCTKNMQDSNYWHYALQLQLYEILLKVENYIKKDAKVYRRLCVFSNSKLTVHELPSVMNEAKGLILWLNER